MIVNLYHFGQIQETSNYYFFFFFPSNIFFLIFPRKYDLTLNANFIEMSSYFSRKKEEKHFKKGLVEFFPSMLSVNT